MAQLVHPAQPKGWRIFALWHAREDIPPEDERGPPPGLSGGPANPCSHDGTRPAVAAGSARRSHLGVARLRLRIAP